MARREFSVVIRKDDNFCLRKEKGYFKYLNDVKVFIYRDRTLFGGWQVIDVATGMAFAKGNSMSDAIVFGLDKLQSFKKYQEKRNTMF